MEFPLFDFALACLLMGLGIGIDVAVATIARAGQLRTLRLAVIWIFGVSATHTLFPMAGYLFTYFSVQIMPGVTPLIGLVAFTCIFIYLKSELIQLARPETESDNTQLLVTLGLILAVSWDALWSGPAKSAQVIGWPEILVWLSFIVVGALVSVLAMGSLKFAQVIQSYCARRDYINWFGLWVQFSVISYFGFLALFRYTFQIGLSWWQILMVSAFVIGGCLVFAARFKRECKVAQAQ